MVILVVVSNEISLVSEFVPGEEFGNDSFRTLRYHLMNCFSRAI